MTPQLQHTLCDHATGNYRVLARAKIIQSSLKSMRLIGLDNPREMRTINDLFILSKFKRNQVEWKTVFTRCIQCKSEARLWMINSIGHEIDVQAAVKTQTSRCFNGFNPACLVKCVSVSLCDLSQDGSRRLT
uniref:Uncharacterized protein n=1 Tax=mine drainage metagenome TaxID=410659 RepID=E6QQ72_9ZZZZ